MIQTDVQTNEIKITAQKLDWLRRVNLVYGVAGLIILAQFGTTGAVKSFIAGWAISFANLELFKRLGLMILEVFQGGRLNPVFYGLLIVKFSFWGLIIALFSLVDWIQAIPFVLGNITLIVAASALGVKELYAR